MNTAAASKLFLPFIALCASVAWAQESAEPASKADLEALVEQLNVALEERDAVILQLLERVQALESQLQAQAKTVPTGASERAELAAATLSAEDELDEVDRLAQSALERTLIETGGLLLSPGTFEVQPGFSYSLTATNTVDVDCLLIADILCIGDINSKRYRRESYLSDWTFRLGLPWDMQLDTRVPFSYERSTAVFGDGDTEILDKEELGDISVGLSKQLLREDGWKPGVLGELRWKGRSGGDPYDTLDWQLASGTGFDELGAGLSFVKVRDPLVMFGNVNYSYSFADEKPEIGDVQPGEGLEAQLGMAIALNLETSLNFSFTQAWYQRTRVDDERIAGTSRRPGSLRIGAAYVPAAGSNIDFSVAFGLTDDAPDVEARLSFPWRSDYRLPFLIPDED